MIDALTLERIIQYFIPGVFSVLFRIYGLGAKSKRHAMIGMVYYVIVSIGVPALLIPTLGYDIYREIAIFVTFFANLAVFIISSDSFLKTCFLHVTQLNIVYWISIVSSSVRRMFDLSYADGNMMRLVLGVVIFVLGLRYFVKPLRFIVDTIRSAWWEMLAVPLCINLAGVAMAMYCSSMPTYPEELMIAVMTFLEISLLTYLLGLSRTLAESQQLSRERHHHDLLQTEIRALDHAVDTAKRHRHDMRHHNAVLLEHLQVGQVEKAIAYLEQLNQDAQAPVYRQFCKNPTANAVLRIYSHKAEEQGIAFTAEAVIPEQFPVADTLLSALLSNLLENAVEACEKVPQRAREITLSAQQVNLGWKLELRNTMAGTADFHGKLPQSTKPRGGCGTRNIRSIVEGYGGILRFRQEEHWFITRIFIPM